MLQVLLQCGVSIVQFYDLWSQFGMRNHNAWLCVNDGSVVTGSEAIRGEMGWSSFKERGVKAILNFKVGMELMNNNRWVKTVGKWGGEKIRLGQMLRKS